MDKYPSVLVGGRLKMQTACPGSKGLQQDRGQYDQEHSTWMEEKGLIIALGIHLTTCGWNAITGFGPCGTRKTVINRASLSDGQRLERFPVRRG